MISSKMDNTTFCIQRATAYLEYLLCCVGFTFLKPQHLGPAVLVAGRESCGLILVFDGVEQAPSAEPPAVPPELAFLNLPAKRIAVYQDPDESLTLYLDQALMDLFPPRKAREFGIRIQLLP